MPGKAFSIAGHQTPTGPFRLDWKSVIDEDEPPASSQTRKHGSEAREEEEEVRIAGRVTQVAFLAVFLHD